MSIVSVNDFVVRFANVNGSGSASANAMFASPQAAAATALGVGALPVMAMQNVAASLLVMASPARIELAVRLCPTPPGRARITRTILGVNAAIIAVLVVVSLMLTHP